MDELSTFEEFTSQHIRPDPDRSVQCMLLWTEWVRFYMKQSRSFPEKVLEKTFFTMVADQFDSEIAVDDFRGPVYLGLCFKK